MINCKNCSAQFEFTQSEAELTDRVAPIIDGKILSIPEPSHCPDCRQQRRLAWRNERNLYKRMCDLCKSSMLSIYNEKAPFPVYCQPCWWSDKWDPMIYGRTYDFSRSFFEQFKDLQNTVPHMAMLTLQNENSEFTNNVTHLKNCYLLFSSDFNRDCYYGVWIENSNDWLDNLMINKCQLTHEAFFSDNVYNSTYIINSSLCRDSAFLFDCSNCSDCFMSYGLRNKQYHINNKEYSKEDYYKEMEKLSLGSYKTYEAVKKKFVEMIKEAACMHMWRNGRVIESSGAFLADVMNCKDSFEIIEGRDCKYVQGGYQIKDAHDCCYVNGELGYENCECFPMPQKSAFNANCYNGNDLYYNEMCMNDNKNIFGNVSLKKKQYCILNKEYSKEEYEKLVPQIVESMKTAGEWGEFFPITSSTFAYNETNANEFFPITKEAAIEKGYSWKEREATEYQASSYTIPDDIKDVPDNIIDAKLSCISCNKNYKIIAQELRLLKQINLPIPRKCFECRLGDRSKIRVGRKLYLRACAECKKEIETNFPDEHPQKIFCEECYLKKVY